MQIIPLSEGSFTVDKSKRFIPFDKSNDEMEVRTAGSLLVEVQPFAVITSKDILVLDTGLGFQKNGRIQLHQNLIDQGIEPSSVTKVLLSHLHKDHSGGVGVEGPANSGKALSFSNATYYLQRRELDFAFEKGFPSFITEDIQVLKGSSKVILLDEDTGTIDNYIHYEVTGAHSLYHQVFRIDEMDEIIFFGGDDAPQLQQMKHRFIAKYDHDGRKAMELRSKWWDEGKNEGWKFLFYHDVTNPIFEF